MYENLKNIAAKRNIGIYYMQDQQVRIDIFLYELLQADAGEVNTSTGKLHRFDISSASGYAALSYALIPYGFTEQNAEAAALGMNVLTRVPRWARGKRVGRG